MWTNLAEARALVSAVLRFALSSALRMLKMIVRTATSSDLDALAKLFDAYRQFYQQPADVVAARSFLAARMAAQESVILVAESRPAELIGFCQLYPGFCSVAAGPIYILYDLFVSADGRHQGVGRALMLAAEDQARRDGKLRMDLMTARSNLPAQALYASLGWVRDEIYCNYSKALVP